MDGHLIYSEQVLLQVNRIKGRKVPNALCTIET
jgi:hypothetical protein